MIASCTCIACFELLSEFRGSDRLREGGAGRLCEETAEGEGSPQDHLLCQWRDHGGVQHRGRGGRGGACEERRRHCRFGRMRTKSFTVTLLKPS